MKRFCLSIFALLAAASVFAQNGPVKMWEGTIDLPTYRVNAPEKAPLFERDFAYQRAKRAVYPYAMNDNPTNEKVDSTHRALYLENDYIKVCVLPDIGGRLFYATDKTNGYEIFYRQHVIKPANVGMLGAWLSGGVEWNVFHHHRATSQFPIDYKLVDNGDGSKSIWVGEIEHRHRMSWAIGLTLYPETSYIEVTGRFFNDSGDRNSMLHWNNVATHSNENYQVLFPETTQFGMFHHKSSHIHWPIANEPYKGNADFIGVDVSYWKNLPSLTGDSVFIQDLQDDWVGGYDYGVNAGTMLSGNHNICKGGKFWTWGHKAYGHAWDSETLTDSDGAYVELMTSAYSDNQPDYCWINPNETKEFTAYWYGIRDLKNEKNASTDSSDKIHVRGNEKATVNIEAGADGRIHIAANTTRIRPNAIVKVTCDGREVYSKIALIAPHKPFHDNFSVDPALTADPQKCVIGLYSNEGELLIDHHQHVHDINSPLPEDLKPVNPDPKSVESIEELYYIGMRNLQFHQAHVDPNDYFLEVLRRDPLDVRCNTQMGIYYRKNGDNEKAKHYLRTALKRETANYTRPADGEAMYNLGLVLKSEQNWHDAIDTLYRAAWDYEYASAAYYQLAQTSCLMGNSAKALQEARMAVKYNGMNIDAKNLVTSLLRKTGLREKAIQMAKDVAEFDPLNFYATRELSIMGAIPTQDYSKLLRGESESYLDLALYYMNNGFMDDCKAVLLEAESIKPYPTVEYYLGYLADSDGNREDALSWFKSAESLSTDYIYPFRLETASVLELALKYIPESANTWYYLGNLWFQKRPELALNCWLKATEIDSEFAMALRNIGWAYRFRNEGKPYKDASDYNTAIEYYLKAIAADKDGNALFLAECDEIMEQINAPLEDRYNLFNGREEHYQKRYDSETKAIKQRILHGEYVEVLEPLTTRFYSRREHIEDLHDIYVDACLLSGFKAWSCGDDQKALEYMMMANEYPANLGYAHLEYDARDAQVYYNIGLAYEKIGDKTSANEWYKKASEVEVKDKDAVYLYEKGLAMKKLDPKVDVKSLYKHILECGKSMETEYYNTFFESFDHGPFEQDINAVAYYTQGIANLALGKNGAARNAFRKALEQRNDNVWANYYLGNMK